MGTKTESSRASDPEPRGRGRYTMGTVDSLETLLGAHPAALRDHYHVGTPARPKTFGSAGDGRLLGVAGTGATYMLTRPLVMTVAKHLLPWRGKSFDSMGTGGRNRILHWKMFPFRAETGASELDGKPTLFLRYDGQKNPWPISHVVDELRSISPTVAIGPASLRTPRGNILLFWWGLQTAE